MLQCACDHDVFREGFCTYKICFVMFFISKSSICLYMELHVRLVYSIAFDPTIDKDNGSFIHTCTYMYVHTYCIKRMILAYCVSSYIHVHTCTHVRTCICNIIIRNIIIRMRGWYLHALCQRVFLLSFFGGYQLENMC